MKREIKFKAIIHLETEDVLLEQVAVYPDGMIGFSSNEFEKILPKNHILDWDDDCIRHQTEDGEIFDNVLGILTGEDWIWIDDESRFTLLQFTGLKDKNKIDIYEGDLLLRVEDDYTIEFKGVVKYNYLEFTADDLKGSGDSVLYYKSELIEKIGSIHDNKK